MSAQMIRPSKYRGNVLVIYGPQGCGKTTNAKALGEHFNARTVIDDWDGKLVLKKGAVALIQTDRTQGLRSKFTAYQFISFTQAMGRANLVNTLHGQQPNAIYMKLTKARLVEMIENLETKRVALNNRFITARAQITEADEKNLRLISDGIERERIIQRINCTKVDLRLANNTLRNEAIDHCKTIDGLNSQLADRSGELCEVMEENFKWAQRFWKLFNKHTDSVSDE